MARGRKPSGGARKPGSARKKGSGARGSGGSSSRGRALSPRKKAGGRRKAPGTGKPGVGKRGSERAGSSRGLSGPKHIAGVVTRRGKHLEIEPLFQTGSPFLIAREGSRSVEVGDVVLGQYSHGRRLRVTRKVGRRDRLEDVIEALMLDTVVERGFSAEVLQETAEATEAADRHDHHRADLRDLFTFTVDPETARDFDDALSFEATSEGVRVFVHIADVSYFVEEETELDREALRRATSIYVPTGVEPMLPQILSAGVCSLQPETDRKAVTVEMELDRGGRVLSVKFYRSLIRSGLRLDYDQLEEIFQDRRQPSPELSEALELGRPLAQTLRDNRYERGSLRITSTEPEFHFAGDRIVSAHAAEELESHNFIEEYMILTNEQVGSFLEREKVPNVYRVHDTPDPFGLDHLLNVLEELEVPTPPFDALTATPGQVRRVMREVAEMIERFRPAGRGRAALVQQVLRAQSRAVYQTHNIGHFGLALGTYSHFTSPIRRYPDLLTHRALLGHLQLGPQPTTATLSEWAEHCSLREREASKVELKADDLALAFLLERRLKEEGADTVFEGQIMGFVGSGAFVLFDRLYEGFLPARALPDDYYELNDQETALVGRRTGRAFRLADLLPIQVSQIDAARGRVDLVPAPPGLGG